jgi:hypothetical protein
VIACLTLSCGSDAENSDPIRESSARADAALSEVTRASDAEVETILRALVGEDIEPAREAVKKIVSLGDPRFASVLIELMRASQVQILHADGRTAYSRALEAISGQLLGDHWGAWVEWYDASDLKPPPGFTRWKGELLGRLDPAFAAFLYEGAPATIRVEEIIWGGVAFDGIPALNRPGFIPASAAAYLEPSDAVFGLSIKGDTRAYPLRILDWHEMVNDEIGGVPVSLTYCTLCGAGIAYDTRSDDGRVFHFASSGLLMRSNKLMADAETRSLWNQFTGRPVVGELVRSGVRLKRLPLVVARWSEWRDAHPETRVLDIDTGFERDYSAGAAYAGYFATPDLMFPVRQQSPLLAAKAHVYGLEIGGAAKAYPIDRLVERQVINDRLALTSVVLVANRGVIRVEGRSARSGPAVYPAGGEVRAYDRGDHRFEPGPDADSLLDVDGARWRISEDALLGPSGERLPRIAGHVSYWFAWSAFHRETQVWSPR